MSKWKEIRNDYTDDIGVTSIDGYLTGNDNEEGKSIALIVSGQVYYKDYDAITDSYAQEMIKEAIALQKEETLPDFITPTEGLELLKTAYAKSEVSGGEFIDSVKFSNQTKYSLISAAAMLFRIWDWDFEQDDLTIESTPQGFTGNVIRMNDAGEKKQALIDQVIENIKKDMFDGDLTAVDNLLSFIPMKYLEGYLPENTKTYGIKGYEDEDGYEKRNFEIISYDEEKSIDGAKKTIQLILETNLTKFTIFKIHSSDDEEIETFIVKEGKLIKYNS